MRQKATKEVRTCDHCKKEVERDLAAHGGNPFTGWLLVEFEQGVVHQVNGGESHDFCSKKCCGEFFTA
jgi:hypothetical protein